MLSMRRALSLSSNCRTYCKIKMQYLNKRKLSNSTPTRKSALFYKTQSTKFQVNIPVELDLDINQRLCDTSRLLSEVSLRNVTDVSVSQLEKDFQILTDLQSKKEDLEKQRVEISSKFAKLQKKQKEITRGEDRENVERELNEILLKGKKLKEELKAIEPKMWDFEEKVMLAALKLPNKLHKNAPFLQDRIEDNSGTVECHTNRTSHVEIGEKFDLIKFSSLGNKAYYFTDSLALMEQALIQYFSDILRQDGFTQMACPDFFQALVMEGCGVDCHNSKEVLKLSQEHDDTFLAGMSVMSFAAYVTKSRLVQSCLPLKYFACGRSYNTVSDLGDGMTGLFGATQSVKMNICYLCKTSDECDASFEAIKVKLWNIYKQFNIPCRLVTVSAKQLNNTEEMKTEIQMWAKSIQQYIKVASVSILGDYISRRLMIRQGPKALPVHMVYCEALDITRLIAVITEYGSIQENTYSLPELHFLKNYWIQPKG